MGYPKMYAGAVVRGAVIQGLLPPTAPTRVSLTGAQGAGSRQPRLHIRRPPGVQKLFHSLAMRHPPLLVATATDCGALIGEVWHSLHAPSPPKKPLSHPMGEVEHLSHKPVFKETSSVANGGSLHMVRGSSLQQALSALPNHSTLSAN